MSSDTSDGGVSAMSYTQAMQDYSGDSFKDLDMAHFLVEQGYTKEAVKMCHRNLVHSTTLNLFATAHFMLIALLYDPDPNLEREDVLDKISLVLDEYIATEPTHILGHQQIRKFIAIVQNRLHLVRRPKATQNVFMSEFEEQSEANIIIPRIVGRSQGRLVSFESHISENWVRGPSMLVTESVRLEQRRRAAETLEEAQVRLGRENEIRQQERSRVEQEAIQRHERKLAQRLQEQADADHKRAEVEIQRELRKNATLIAGHVTPPQMSAKPRIMLRLKGLARIGSIENDQRLQTPIASDGQTSHGPSIIPAQSNQAVQNSAADVVPSPSNHIVPAVSNQYNRKLQNPAAYGEPSQINHRASNQETEAAEAGARRLRMLELNFRRYYEENLKEGRIVGQAHFDTERRYILYAMNQKRLGAQAMTREQWLDTGYAYLTRFKENQAIQMYRPQLEHQSRQDQQNILHEQDILEHQSRESENRGALIRPLTPNRSANQSPQGQGSQIQAAQLHQSPPAMNSLGSHDQGQDTQGQGHQSQNSAQSSPMLTSQEQQSQRPQTPSSESSPVHQTHEPPLYSASGDLTQLPHPTSMINYQASDVQDQQAQWQVTQDTPGMADRGSKGQKRSDQGSVEDQGSSKKRKL